MSPPFRIPYARATQAICHHQARTFGYNGARSTAFAFSNQLGRTSSVSSLYAVKSSHYFSTTPALLKKNKGKSAQAEPAAVADPFDFSPLSDGIQRAVLRLQEDLAKLQSRGRLNPEIIENVRVTLRSTSGQEKHKQIVKLKDLAQVIPKGRMITIIVGAEDYTKPITSALQAAPSLSLNPQPDSRNKLQLNLPIPPPTRESRDEALKAAKLDFEKAGKAVKDARASIQKKLKAMGSNKTIRPDDLHKALEQMEKMTERGQKEVKNAFENARQAFERE
ncbi:ribosome-recycling factor [Ophidiomyces ophidiicola]|uniref:ribosome-recycling factor n=1 Tax=Ophidiomyces ophidiicola TaxID=1387563 RepID=UPI0020C585F2|nr:ribosome-recycling factor [Ophidiomyces ophidiicola]KAI1917148.1 ribosome-recycling factor [Ophidiomyces ophidiicola]KAI1929732.1 ribosome-recycling factor [Ophidiomyces ophidiicola]KAI1946466.1 ribosome-recycling factor [Ophidiomyces ophidiicola]KAI1960486.1 ribosome-recycling factor [Ophidiomyces ophidiicola]KAI1969426.1 ribosome-recycling factor [Ophidiomyces ophidiicola]